MHHVGGNSIDRKMNVFETLIVFELLFAVCKFSQTFRTLTVKNRLFFIYWQYLLIIHCYGNVLQYVTKYIYMDK